MCVKEKERDLIFITYQQLSFLICALLILHVHVTFCERSNKNCIANETCNRYLKSAFLSEIHVHLFFLTKWSQRIANCWISLVLLAYQVTACTAISFDNVELKILYLSKNKMRAIFYGYLRETVSKKDIKMRARVIAV